MRQYVVDAFTDKVFHGLWQTLTSVCGAKYAGGIFRLDYVTVGVDGCMTVVFRDGTGVEM